MADDNEELELPIEDKSPSILPKLVIGLVVLIALYFGIFSNDDSGSKKQTDQKVEEDIKLDSNVSAIDVSAAFRKYNNDLLLADDKNKKLSNSIARLEKDTKDRAKETKQTIKELRFDLTKKMDDVVETFRSFQDETNDTQYGNSNIELGGVQFDESDILDESLETDKEQIEKPKLKQLKSNFIALNLWEESTSAEIANGATSTVDEVTGLFTSSEIEEATTSKDNSKKTQPDNIMTVPSLSWADATTFHGLRCPIINGIASVAGNTDEAPVTMKIRGIFHGPNGDSVDLGPVHIAGTCSGIRTGDSDYGIANITLTELSYATEESSKGSESLEGYVLDIENPDNMNMPGLRGPIDAVQASTLADSAIAAALSMASFGFQATQTSTVTNLATNTATSSFDGNPIEHLATQGLGGYFVDLYENFKTLKDTAVDSVIVKSGTKIRIFIKDELQIPLPKKVRDVFEDDSEQRYL